MSRRNYILIKHAANIISNRTAEADGNAGKWPKTKVLDFLTIPPDDQAR